LKRVPELYDVHTHVGCDTGFFLRGWWPYAATAQDLLERMGENSIDRAVCFPFTLPSAFDPYAFATRGEVKLIEGRFPFDRENHLLANEIERVDSDKRLIQFAMFDPSRQIDQQVKRIESLIGKIGGLKTQSTVLQSPIQNLLNSGRSLMKLAQQHGLPVLFHTSIIQSDTWAQVSDCLAIAEALPKVRYNHPHSLRFHAALLKRAAQLPNVWVDCSAHLNHVKLARDNSPVVPPPGVRVDADYSDPLKAMLAVHDIVGEKYLWGSDNPFMSWCDDKFRLMFSYKLEADVLHALPEKVKLSMAHHAPKNWLAGKS
jgi:predicted TIM-barrel fold metal-dependent hydrolase